ncbi:hypothetical protein ACF0H5_009480 [Mactra antiquata]
METTNEKNEEECENIDIDASDSVFYGVEDVPSPLPCFIFGLQQAIMTIGGTLSIPFILASLLCSENKSDLISTLLSITMFMCGLATILQSLFGIRLGIIQGGSHTFVAPIVAMMALNKWNCPDVDSPTSTNTTNDDDIWKDQMREIQGNLMLASVTQMILGSTGLIGVLLPFIGPITIAPTISLIGLSLTEVVVSFSEYHWGIAFLSACLTLIFTLYLRRVKLPIPVCSFKKGCHIIKYPIFQLFPVILGIGVSWFVCLILTVSDVFPNDATKPSYMARTDSRIDVLNRAKWFYWPLPFQFGLPTVTAAGYVGFLAATISSIIESIGDYYAAARLSGSAPPPSHAINRGIAMEGVCSIVSGMVGASHGTTSYSGNIGVIGITKVASRAVFVTAGVILMVCGVVGKIGAVLTLIPDPVIGGTLAVMFGMVSAVGISTLQFIDLESTRNLTIIGVSLLLGLMIPQYVNNPKHADNINTGNTDLDQAIKVLLGTAMFVGGFIGCFLDNTVPGSDEERGILQWRKNQMNSSTNKNQSLQVYEYPYITKHIRRIQCCSYVPVSPTFNKEIAATCDCCKSKRRENVHSTGHVNQVAIDDKDIELQKNSLRL